MKQFAVIGLGKFGYYIAKTLFEDNNTVIAIDLDKAKVQAIDPYSSRAIVMDATKKEELQQLGLETMEAVFVATGKQTSMSILICLHLLEIGVKNVLAKAEDEDHGKILLRVGASEVIHPEREMAIRVARSLSRPNVLDYIPLGHDFNLIEVITPASFVGKSLKSLDIRAKYNVHVIAVKKEHTEHTILAPAPDFIFKKGDSLMILGKHANIEQIKELKLG